MKMRLFLFTMSSFLVSLALLLAFLFTLQVAAEGPQPRPYPGAATGEGAGGKPFPGADGAGHAHIAASDAPGVALGQPGLSFRYVQTFGVTETAYIEDNSHFYAVGGIGVDGANVWVTDSWSDRVLKFDGDGNFQQKIGTAGFIDSSGTSLSYITDVAVDGSGNVWVVDAGAAHVVKYDSSGDWVSELGDAWDRGTGNDRFNDPIGIAFDGAGNIYVSDSALWDDDGNQRIQVFDSSGSYLATIGETGVAGSDANHFYGPRHIAVYGTYLYVADAGNHRVQMCDISDPTAASCSTAVGVSGIDGGDNGHLDYPEGVWVDATDIYVADSNNDRVQIFDRTTRAYVATLGTGGGAGDYEFAYPTDVAVDSADRIYVADKDNKRVQQFNSSHTYLRTYGTTGVSYVTDGYHYYTPPGVAVAGDGSIYIVEEKGHRLVKLNANGAPQWTVGEAGQGGYDNSHFHGPQDVAVDASGRVYVVESWDNYRVQIFNSNGSYYATLGTGAGSGNYQFESPGGVAIDKSGNIYVADTNNHRVQIYNAGRTYVAHLGETGVAGLDDTHFDGPQDVAVDSNGTIYVADEGNHRIQVFNSSRQYVRTIGQTGSPGDDFDRFSDWGPHRLAVDAQNRLYVTDAGNARVQVFDSSGAYLTTIGGSGGTGTSQFSNVMGIAAGPDGSIYVSEVDNNHRIQKFAPGVQGWRQVNINGFGYPGTWNTGSGLFGLAEFNGQLYAGGRDQNNGQIWRHAGSEWTPMLSDGFDGSEYWMVEHLVVFHNQLYAGAWTWDDGIDANGGGEVWRSPSGNTGTWSQVVSGGFDDVTNSDIWRLGVFKDSILAATWSSTTTHGLEIWRSSSGNAGSWSQVVPNGFGDANNEGIASLQEFNDYMYVGTYNSQTGGEVWHSQSGDASTWEQVNADGFGDPDAYEVCAMAAFGDYLYASTSYKWGKGKGADVWRCQECDGSDWQRVITNGFDNPSTRTMSALEVFDGQLYLAVGNTTTGLEVRRTVDGTTWEQVGFAGLGDSNNYGTFDSLLVVSTDRLYLGTQNEANGVEVWSYLDKQVYLPLVLRD
jgi:uncharacterized protein YjiK